MLIFLYTFFKRLYRQILYVKQIYFHAYILQINKIVFFLNFKLVKIIQYATIAMLQVIKLARN